MILKYKGETIGGGGSAGMTPYEYAVAGGYEGTEEEFKAIMADPASVPYVDSAVQDVYSTEETRIGTWIDGKPIYRRCFLATIPGNVSTNATVELLHVEIPVDNMVDLFGSGKTSNGQWSPLPYYQSTSDMIYIGYNPPTHTTSPSSVRVSASATYKNQLISVILEYTKTTDQATISIPAALFQQETLDEAQEVAVDSIRLDQQTTD